MTTIIRDVRILGPGGRLGPPGGWLEVSGTRIVAVGDGPRGTPPPSVRVVDGHGMTAMPGLIDCHAHAVGFHRGDRRREPEPREAAADTIDVIDGLRRVLESGVTTLRDCGYPHHGIFAVREAADAGVIAAPRLVLSGRAVSATAGHGASIAVEVSGPDEARRAVRLEAKAGADWIKLMVTGGTATPGEAVTDVQITLEEARAAVEEAHRRGRRVSAHCSNLPGTKLALEAGVDSIEHGIAIDRAAAERMAAEGTWLAPSLLCTQVEGTAGPESGIPEYVRRKGAEIFRLQQESFQCALAAGVRIAAATDAEVPYLPLGAETLARELALMVALGMAPRDAIDAATVWAAQLLGLDGDLGALEVGHLADIILVAGDPLTDVTLVGAPQVVMYGGRVVRGPIADGTVGEEEGAR